MHHNKVTVSRLIDREKELIGTGLIEAWEI